MLTSDFDLGKNGAALVAVLKAAFGVEELFTIWTYDSVVIGVRKASASAGLERGEQLTVAELLAHEEGGPVALHVISQFEERHLAVDELIGASTKLVGLEDLVLGVVGLPT